MTKPTYQDLAENLAQVADHYMGSEGGLSANVSATEETLELLIRLELAERCGFANSKARFTGDIYDQEFIRSKVAL